MQWPYTYLPIGPFKKAALGWSRYRDANPVPTSRLADNITTAPLGPVLNENTFCGCYFLYCFGKIHSQFSATIAFKNSKHTYFYFGMNSLRENIANPTAQFVLIWSSQFILDGGAPSARMSQRDNRN